MEYREFNTDHARPQPLDRCLKALVRIGKFCLLLLAVPVVIAIYKKPLAEQNAMRAKLAGMESQRDALKAERDKLLRQVEWIKTDASYLETRARDHENMHKKGEYVIRFVE